MITLKQLLIRLGGTILGIGLIIYIIHQGWALIIGPRIIIREPLDGMVTTEQDIHIIGIAKNTTFITLNGMPILIDEQGNFDIPYVLSPGPAAIAMYARDRFGNEYAETRTIVYHPPERNYSTPPSNTLPSDAEITSEGAPSSVTPNTTLNAPPNGSTETPTRE
ncbi:MAG: hypothetical protein HGA67_04295 [Candidatus Yonathbacteria bacterium]|nr:hypothetical protein [Candidatus Yonathbacteria bacterium]